MTLYQFAAKEGAALTHPLSADPESNVFQMYLLRNSTPAEPVSLRAPRLIAARILYTGRESNFSCRSLVRKHVAQEKQQNARIGK